MMSAQDNYTGIPPTIKKLLVNLLRVHGHAELVNEKESLQKKSDQLLPILLSMIFNKDIPIPSRIVILQAYRYLMVSLKIPDEFVELIIESIQTEQCPNWISELLTACIGFSVESEHGLKLFQCKEFFMCIQSIYLTAPYKAGMLLVCIINKKLAAYFDRNIFTIALLHSSYGIIQKNLGVLIGYAEGYKELSLELPEKSNFLISITAKDFSKTDLGYIFIWLCKVEKSALMFPSIVFLAKQSREAMYYLDRLGGFVEIMRKELNLLSLNPENTIIYLRLNHFLENLLPLSERFQHIVSELEYIDVIMQMIENEMKKEIFSAVSFSSFQILKILSRTQEITVDYLSTYRMTNLVENIAMTAHNYFKEDRYPELCISIIEFFFYVGNLVVYNHHWKEIAINSIIPYVHRYLPIQEFQDCVMKFMCDILFESTSEITQTFIQHIKLQEIQERATSLERKIVFMSILKNILANSKGIAVLPSLVEDILSEILLVANADSSTIIDVGNDHNTSLSMLCSEIILILANIAIVSPLHGIKKEIVELSVDMFRKAPTSEVFLSFLSYLINISCAPILSSLPSLQMDHHQISKMEIIKKPLNKCIGFSSICADTLNDIIFILKERIGKDQEVDFKIKKFLSKIKLL
ncbi:hypothetical protein NEPAR04_1569 [Nematocida parisii]|nr:hypothetical protein NEPAR03_1813 [Nematocida parisii]KAI5129973.1 hypothetical protein NEPAR08_1792 [Nematocida parisii]KAI5142646.1 hypothetical protein NEPAR04_1569 [Nematocida parisii]